MPEENNAAWIDEEWASGCWSLRETLLKLRTREGLTPGHIQRSAPWLLRFLEVPTAQDAYDLIQETLDGMVQDKHTKALRNSFGGEGYSESAKERREVFAAAQGKSVHTIATWEEVAVGLVADRLVHALRSRLPGKT